MDSTKNDLPQASRARLIVEMQVDLLEHDMRALKLLSHREYIRHLLPLRLQGLMEARHPFPAQ